MEQGCRGYQTFPSTCMGIVESRAWSSPDTCTAEKVGFQRKRKDKQSRYKEGSRDAIADIVFALPKFSWVPFTRSMCAHSQVALAAPCSHRWLSEDCPWVLEPPHPYLELGALREFWLSLCPSSSLTLNYNHQLMNVLVQKSTSIAWGSTNSEV